MSLLKLNSLLNVRRHRHKPGYRYPSDSSRKSMALYLDQFKLSWHGSLQRELAWKLEAYGIHLPVFKCKINYPDSREWNILAGGCSLTTGAVIYKSNVYTASTIKYLEEVVLIKKRVKLGFLATSLKIVRSHRAPFI